LAGLLQAKASGDRNRIPPIAKEKSKYLSEGRNRRNALTKAKETRFLEDRPPKISLYSLRMANMG